MGGAKRQRYAIDPEGVERVLRVTAANGRRFGDLVEPIEGQVSAAVEGTGDAGAITYAMRDFLAVQGKRMAVISTRVEASVTGAAKATRAFCRGDEEMVGAYQTEAVRRAAVRPK